MDLPPAVETAKARLPSARKAVVAIVVAIVALVLLFGLLVATGVLSQPTVQSIDRGWGTVTNDSTQIETQVIVDNPNPVGIPGVITVEYTAALNDVVLTEHSRSGIALASGSNTINLESSMDNDRIADWWVTHVNNGENSTMRIDSEVRGPGFSRTLPTDSTTIETDLLSSFGAEGEESVTLDNETLLVLGDQDAAWGEADNETTTLSMTTTLENAHDAPVTIDGVEYVVEMNSVTLGAGRTTDGVEVAPGESGTLTVDAALNTSAFGDWWPTHVRNDESSQMTVELYGLVERNGTQTRVPIRLFADRLELETDMLGTGETSVRSLPTERSTLESPTVENTEREWGTITDATTEVLTNVTVANPTTDTAINEFVRVSATTETAINDLVVGSGERSNLTLESGTNTISLVTELDNGLVPNWWARHINGGETTTVNTTTTTTADVGITTLDVPTPAPNSTFQTDMLADLNTDEDQPIEEDGDVILVAEETSAEWGTATPEEAPIDASSVVRNEQLVPVEIQRIDYTVHINKLVLANGSHTENTVVAPGGRETIHLPMTLDNSKMDEWWVTHLESGERSMLSVDATATISVGGETRTVPLEMFSKDDTVETDILGR